MNGFDSIPTLERGGQEAVQAVTYIVGAFIVQDVDCIVQVHDGREQWLVMGQKAWDELPKKQAGGAFVTAFGVVGEPRVVSLEDAPPPVQGMLRQLALCAGSLMALPTLAARGLC